MNALKYLFLLFVASVLFLSCTENNTTEIINSKTRTLIILSDMARSSDMMIGVEAIVNKNHPDVEIKYIEAKAFDYKDAAYTVARMASEYKGQDSIYFAMVVEPGGEDSRIIFETNNQLFLGPDNGIATRLINNYGLKEFYRVENPKVLGGDGQTNMSTSLFYKEAINSMLKDLPLEDFGKVITDPVLFPTQEAENIDDKVVGEILYIDNFGNCTSNIQGYHLNDFAIGDLIKVTTNEKAFYTLYGFDYSSVNVGQNVCVINATNSFLKFAVNMGDASERYSMSASTFVTINKGKAKIGILRFNQSVDSDNIIAGMKAAISNGGAKIAKDLEYIEVNAEGDASKLTILAKQLVDAGVDMIVPVSTPAAQAAVHEVPNDIPIVFTYITDPISAGLYDVRGNITGLSDQTNFDDYLGFIKEVMPDLAIGGRIYNDKESNSAYAQEKILSFSNYYSLEIVSATTEDPDMVDIAYQKVIAKDAEAILVGSDNTVANAITTLAQKCKQDSIPLFSDSFAHTKDGALASISVDYDELATKTGELIIAVLLGESPDDIPFKKFDTNVIAVNKSTATAIGFAIPQEILDKAKYIYE
jgi:putative tryptophan/tyrosine transport system substrate-binding protein